MQHNEVCTSGVDGFIRAAAAQTSANGATDRVETRASMGNLCCGEDDVPHKRAKQSVSGGAPPSNVMTPTASQRREQALQAAEERARKDAVRGTQRTRYVL